MAGLQNLTAIYYDNGDGTASHSGSYVSASGDTMQMGIAPGYGANIRISEIPQWARAGYAITVQPRQMQRAGLSPVGINPMNPVLPGRTVGNETQAVRVDVPSLIQDDLFWQLNLDARECADGTFFKGVIGDPTSVIQRQLAIPAPPVGAAVTGTFDAATLTQINDFIKNGNAYAFNFQGKASSVEDLDAADLWALTPFKEANSDLQGSVTARAMDFMSMQDGNQYNEKYRLKREWKFLFARLNAIYFNIPAGYYVSLTMKVKSYAEAGLNVLQK